MLGLIEGAHHVFAKRVVDGGLAADGGVNLGKQCGRHLNERNASLIACRSKADNVAYHAAPQGDEGGVTTMTGFQQSRHDPLEGSQGLVGLAIRQYQVFNLKTGQQLNDLLKIQGGDDCVGHYHDPLALDRLRQHLGALQQTSSYLNRVAALTQFDLQPFHGRPLLITYQST